ncbi:SHOCT domain-containing protein [Roseovarius sp. EL26]|uniref:SHOCT domain-containing protein n=1 Tax=Roseovarius sp. EL26 TaxID=2126672 RepID=UPI0013C4726F|nr:SHOCT domain-containing protein [Roseovarius sp. EL26]
MSKALEIAKERFAKGEITKDEFDEIKFELSSDVETAVQSNDLSPSEVTSVKSEKGNSGFNILKFWWVAVIVLLYLGYASIKNQLIIENLSADSPLFGATTVSAVVYNKGASREYSYHVLKKPSETKHCRGSFFIGKNERRSIKFQCNALTNFNGKFTLITSTN